MSRASTTRLQDIAAACDAIARHVARGDVDDEIVFDAVRVRLIEIGEAAKDLDKSLTAAEPDIPWTDITRMGDHLAHRYFDTTHAVVDATARTDIPLLREAVQRLLDESTTGGPNG